MSTMSERRAEETRRVTQPDIRSSPSHRGDASLEIAGAVVHSPRASGLRFTDGFALRDHGVEAPRHARGRRSAVAGDLRRDVAPVARAAAAMVPADPAQAPAPAGDDRLRPL